MPRRRPRPRAQVIGVSASVVGDMASRPNWGLNELDFVFATLVVRGGQEWGRELLLAVLWWLHTLRRQRGGSTAHGERLRYAPARLPLYYCPPRATA